MPRLMSLKPAPKVTRQNRRKDDRVQQYTRIKEVDLLLNKPADNIYTDTKVNTEFCHVFCKANAGIRNAKSNYCFTRMVRRFRAAYL